MPSRVGWAMDSVMRPTIHNKLHKVDRDQVLLETCTHLLQVEHLGYSLPTIHSYIHLAMGRKYVSQSGLPLCHEIDQLILFFIHTSI
jgi:hypothetical protein